MFSSQWNLGDFFPNFEKKNPNLQKKKKLYFFEDWDFHALNTHTSYKDDVLFQFNGNIVCVITIFFLPKMS